MQNNKKIYTTFLIFALASLLLITFFIWPIFKSIEKNSRDLVSAKNKIVSLGVQEKEIESFKKNYDNYKDNLYEMEQLFVDPDDPVDFIKFLESKASSSQITLQISLPPSGGSSKKSSDDFILFQLASKGRFSDTLNFLKAIEAGPYLLETESASIQNSEIGENESFPKDYSGRKVSATFIVKVFTKK